jgi:CheY-like chemotaxis protein
MESLGRLAGGVAHDFNNLLTVMRGYADVLHDQLSSEDPRLGEVREIRHAADRATALTRQLLAVSRRQVLQPREVDLNALVHEMERMLHRVLGPGIRVITERRHRPAWVRADPGQLEQVLLNLAVNARDAMPDGGSLGIRTGRRTIEPGQEPPGAPDLRAGEFVVLEVRDTGVGMDRDTLGKIFEPFFTTKPDGDGTGLGLSTVYGIVQQSGGFVTVESAPGAGATFRILLPAVAPPARPASEPAVREAAPRRPGRARVLVVEDDDGVRRLARRILEQYGYAVLTAADGAEALAVMAGEAAGVDVVVSDLVMPELTGRELIGRLRERWPGLPALLLSGHSGEESGPLGLAPGQAFLQKPFSPDALVAAIEELLADVRPPATAG